jgi:5-(carboxyamino)imidazole ribonucleotide synthase
MKDVVYENIEKIMALMALHHIFMEKTNTPFRKMGHVTIVNEDMTKLEKLLRCKNSIRVISG